jgi:hypothetical protein
MTTMLKSLLGKNKKNEPTAEEIEALNRATFILRCRVERMFEPKAA